MAVNPKKEEKQEAKSLDWWKLIAENIPLVIAGIAALLSGKVYFDQLEYDRKSLTRFSIPMADTNLSIFTVGDGIENVWGTPQNICMISGKYSVKNIGDFPWEMTRSSIEIHKLPPVNNNDVPDSTDGKFYSRSVSNFLGKETLLHTEPFETSEKVGPEGIYERLFEVHFRVPDEHLDPNQLPYNFVVVANGTGGRLEQDGTVSQKIANIFGKNELKHFYRTSGHCIRPN